MNRIDLPHLLWALEGIEQGEVTNQIIVPQHITKDAVLALDRMLANV
jgi:quinolinate synthase